MSSVSIFTPYRRGEITAAALRLADFCLARGLDLKLNALGPVEKDVHPFWDDRVRAKADSDSSTYAVSFSRDTPQYKATKHLLAIPPHRLVPLTEAVRAAGLFDTVVLPSRQSMDALVATSPELAPGLAWCSWDAGVEPVCRSGTVEEDRIKFYVPMGPDAINAGGLFILNVLKELLMRRSDVDVMIDSDRLWDKRGRKMIVDMARNWPKRFISIIRSPLTVQLQWLHRHDWTFVTDVRAGFGLMLGRSLACGAPVIAYDVPPWSDLVCPGHHGMLIPCEHSISVPWSPVAIPTLGPTVDALLRATREQLALCRTKQWGLELRKAAFERFWAGQFEVD